jgi:sarcosine oxidase
VATYDVIVVGGGAVGTAAAYALARAGKRVALFEQFQVGHNRGSSHGESRIIRHSYTNKDYATLAPEAFSRWRELERESGQELLCMTGGIDLGRATNPALMACRDSLASAEIGHIWMEGEEAQRFVPQFALPENWAVLWQSGAGILNAGRCVQAMARMAAKLGATVTENAVVRVIHARTSSAVVEVETGAGLESHSAGAVIVAAGPWATRWFADLGIAFPLKVTHQQVVYYPVDRPDIWAVGRCPIYIAHGRDGFYGFPVSERAGQIKVAVELDLEIDNPDETPREPDAAALAQLNHTVRTLFRGVRPEPAEVVTCRYTESPDHDFIIDRHPEFPKVVLASPCSGHGFKFSITSGELAAELATTEAGNDASVLWRERFGLARRLA